MYVCVCFYAFVCRSSSILCISLRDLCKCGTKNETKSRQSNAQRAMLGGLSRKPFGLGNVATPAAVSNQWPQSAGQVRPINCSKSRRVFVNWLLAARCLSVVACRLSLGICLSLAVVLALLSLSVFFTVLGFPQFDGHASSYLPTSTPQNQ